MLRKFQEEDSILVQEGILAQTKCTRSLNPDSVCCSYLFYTYFIYVSYIMSIAINIGPCRSGPAARVWDVMYAVLSSAPGDYGYESCVSFISLVVRAADEFWKRVRVG